MQVIRTQKRYDKLWIIHTTEKANDAIHVERNSAVIKEESKVIAPASVKRIDAKYEPIFHGGRLFLDGWRGQISVLLLLQMGCQTGSGRNAVQRRPLHIVMRWLQSLPRRGVTVLKKC